MERLKRIFTLIHIVLWFFVIGNVVWGVVMQGEPLRPKALLIGLYVFYAHLYIFAKYLNKKRYLSYGIHLVAIFFTGPVPFLLFLFLTIEKVNNTADLLSYYLGGLTIVPAFMFASLLVGVVQNLIINTVKKEQLEKQAVQSELVYLKSQINPHFLFNTLNNIHTLVYTQAPTAPEAVMGLSSLMRYMIYESNAPTVPLSIELNYLKDYIGLQQLRYKNSPVVDFQVEGNTEACHVAPLLFIHLLDNAYKHSPARLEANAIKVKVLVKENTLTFTSQNPIGNKRENVLEEPGGVGLPNVQKRLQLLYPKQHSLTIREEKNVFAVTLKITNLEPHANER